MISLSSSTVLIGHHARTKEEAIASIGKVLADNGYIDPKYAASMLGRERVANTYLGEGIAIPHGLPKDRHLIHKTGIAVMQLPDGVEWAPGERACIVVGIAARSEEHINVLSNLTNLLVHEDLVERLRHTNDPEDFVAAIKEAQDAAATPAPGVRLRALTKFIDATIDKTQGLHARPATAIIEAIKAFDADVVIEHGDKSANGRSLASILRLGVGRGGKIRVSAGGPDADAALAAIKAVIEASDVGERVTAGLAHGWSPSQPTAMVPGVSASPGLAVGPLHVVLRRKIVVECTAKDPNRERRLLREAIATARANLRELHDQVLEKSGAGSAAIFLAHDAFLSDPDMLIKAEQHIGAGQSAGWSWQRVFENEAAALEKIDDPVLASRSVDLRDVGVRVLRQLGGAIDEAALHPSEPSILVAEDLTPSDAASLDPALVLGFCTAGGGPTSHAAIIARSLNIPAIVGTGPAILHQTVGATGILDGSRGVLYVDPHDGDLDAARATQRRMMESRKAEALHRHEPAVTTDGVRIEIVANIAAVAEAAQSIEAGGEGVGLMRTEFLFLAHESAPEEDEQFTAYRQMVEALKGRSLILRTMDIGGEKRVPYLNLPPEANPALGVRGIRLCLERPDLFKTQLRAIYRAAAYGPIKIMFPMIATLDDLRGAVGIAEGVRSELRAERIDIGIMIEVPSAVVMAAELAKGVDFFSIGTNDLTQYILAMDRTHPMLARQADGMHPAVLRMIDQTVRAAVGCGKWVGVCGGIAGDPLGAAILTGLGVTELSMSIPSIAAIKARIRSMSMQAARDLAMRALACGSAEEVHQLAIGDGQVWQ